MVYWSQILWGMNVFSWFFAIVIIWELIWKFVAMWKAARKHSLVWFIILAIFNTAGILPILYIYVFSKMKFKPKEEEKPRRRHHRTVRRKRRR